MGLRTPGVGQKYPSFTQVLMSEMVRMLEEQQNVSIVALHRELLKKQHNLQQQPLHVTLSSGDESGIVLQRFEGLPLVNAPRELSSKPTPSLQLRVSLFEHPSNLQKDQMLRWMTTSTPSIVSAITVERVFLIAQSTAVLGNRILQERSPIADGNAIDVPQAARPTLLGLFTRLKATVNEPIGPNLLEDDAVLRIMQDISNACESFLNAVRDCLSSFKKTTLEDLALTPEAGIEGLAERISMRLRLLEVSPLPSLATYDKVQFAGLPIEKERFRKGIQGTSNVLIEYYYYDTDSAVLDNSPASILVQVRKIAALQSEQKDNAFCTLLCRGYVHENLYGPRFGFIYELPDKAAETPIFLLSDCYRPFPTVDLEARKRLAQKIALAICSMHSIGWLHKGIKSQNILLFGRRKVTDRLDNGHQSSSTQPNFEQPYLFGFDCARPDAAESLLHNEWDRQSNLYRHPERWGHPLRFTKVHDIYALVSTLGPTKSTLEIALTKFPVQGILLVEIAFWRPLHALDPENRRFTRISDPEKLRQILLDICEGRLAHAAGSQYARATKICLTKGLGDGMNEWQFQRFVRNHVVEEIS